MEKINKRKLIDMNFQAKIHNMKLSGEFEIRDSTENIEYTEDDDRAVAEAFNKRLMQSKKGI